MQRYKIFIAKLNFRSFDPYNLTYQPKRVNSMFNFYTSKRSFLFILFLMIQGLSYSQVVDEKFERSEFIDDFDVDKGSWPIFTNSDNLFIIQNGEYILNRKNNTTQYAAISNWENQLDAYDLKVNIKLEKVADENGSIGIIFMAQSKGAFIMEFNKHKQFRVKQLIGTAYQFITGNGDDLKEGWVKSSDLKSMGQYNILEVRTADGKYDLYINGIYQISFTEKNYTSGKMGIIIGPSTNAKVDYFYVYSNKKYTHADTLALNDSLKHKKDTTSYSDNSTEVVNALSETVVRLKTQVNKLTAENEDLKRQIATLANAPQKPEVVKVDSEKLQMGKIIKILENQLISTNGSIDSIKRILTNYRKIQEAMEGNENGDIIITLTNTLKSEKVANELLTKTNKSLKDSLSYYKAEYNKLKPPPPPSKAPDKTKAGQGNMPANKQNDPLTPKN